MPRGTLSRITRRSPLAPMALAILLAGCQGLPGASSAAEPAEDPLAGAPSITRGLDAESLSGLLVAELAGQRGDYPRATRGFLDVAERYGSAPLAERATLAARFSEDPQLLDEAARRWQALAPESDAPARLLASLAIQRGDWDAALEQRLAAISRGAQEELTGFVESALEAGADPAPLLARMREHLAGAGEADHDSELATALLEAAAGERAAAEQRLSRLTRVAPELPELWQIRARLALEADTPSAARAAARRGLEVAPGDPRLMLLLARAEIQLGGIEAAEATTDALLDDHGDDPELRLGLARLFLEEEHLPPARRLLLPLVGDDEAPPLAFLLLGAIAEEEGEVDNALLYYRQVPEGEQFLTARLSAARMLIEDDRLLDARAFLRLERLRHEDYRSELVSLEVELLDEAGLVEQADALLDSELSQHPDDERLRYQRAMRAFADGDLAAMEADLRHIIEADPDNANALNALGYTLADADLEGRLGEARELIERAHALEPGNPAILDSQGWVRYRQGDPEGALPWLERAWSAMPDQEIAAHLIEVLWALGEEERARDLLEEARQRFEERPLIDELLQRHPELDAPGRDD
ncbi:tetratricopeptide repeat protein [Halomonas rhizosphaerae]|uniref:Tetratricopeptide repeat protein n=1 Tax=Halomonas rhizosphaerae TaxID=3043296 RepID=A0ABT6UVT7_9GAMM|nr:tetratricopeptide repeat protein [Halomonas rhizosphaerae]MDI5889700.1 tetratricopeptide repeat protein [Halomonas rhizosphaerae]MDI5922092.1 tetratricopeptide repeat protein [Halomonas rhizosphaerae]